MSTPPLVRNAASPKQNARARRKVADVRKQRSQRMRLQLSKYEGREFLWELISDCKVFEDIVGSNEAVREQLGERRIGLRLMADAAAHPELFRQMQVEATARAEKARREAEAYALDDAAEEKEQQEG